VLVAARNGLVHPAISTWKKGGEEGKRGDSEGGTPHHHTVCSARAYSGPLFIY
jgi:hypothetical protein